MFDIKSLPATPVNARKLIMFSKFNNMVIPDEIAVLANQDIVNKESVKNFPFKSNDKEQKAIQYTLDWNNRCIILHNDITSSRIVSLASISLRNAVKPVFPLVMLVKAHSYAQWAKLVAQFWPDKKISVFGSPKYVESTSFMHDIEISASPDWTADVFITSYSSFIWHDCLQFIKPKQLIIDEIENDQSINYRWAAAVHGLFYEIRNCLILLNFQNLISSSVYIDKPTLETGDINPHFLNSLITDYLWAGYSTNTDSFVSMTALTRLSSDKKLPEYLTRKYQNITYLSILPLFGVNTELII